MSSRELFANSRQIHGPQQEQSESGCRRIRSSVAGSLVQLPNKLELGPSLSDPRSVCSAVLRISLGNDCFLSCVLLQCHVSPVFGGVMVRAQLNSLSAMARNFPIANRWRRIDVVAETWVVWPPRVAGSCSKGLLLV